MTFSVREVTLGEVCEIKQGRYLAPNQMEPTPTAECPVPVIGGNGVLGFTNQSTFPFPVPLVTCRGSKCGLMQWAEPPTWISNNAMAVYFKENQGDNFFLHQYLLNSSFDDVTTGSAQPQITVTNLSLKQILLPDLQTQKSISSLMKNIEGKISTNTALSKTLEDIAQTMFKSWFIDFDPVKAKIAGENPVGMDSATAALFPDSMVDSELGLIPKGWIVSILESISSVKYGAPFASKLFNTTKVGQPLIRIRDLKKQSISTWSPEHHPKGFLVTSGELLVGMDGEFNPTIWFGQDALVNQRICKIEPKDFVSNFFLYFTLVPIMRKIEHGSTGSTVIHLGKTDIDAIKIVVPSRELLSAFKSSVEPLLKQMVSLNVQARVLQEARDALLPRLISGELQIPKEMLAL
jgi:type I restriction enzyme S subunit